MLDKLRGELAMRAGTGLRRATIVLLIIACLKILVDGAEIVRSAAQYFEKPKTTQDSYDKLAEAIVNRIKQDPTLPDIPRPDIRVIPAGPDLVIEAGSPLTFEAAYGDHEYAAAVSEYAPGKYLLSNAPNSYIVVEALRIGLEEFLRDEIEGRVFKTEIFGSADGLPVRSSYIYEGDLGVIVDAPYYSHDTNRAERMTLVPGVTRHTNDSVAFLRALDMWRYISGLRQLKNGSTEISTTVSPQIGGDHRRVTLRVTVKDALAEEYNEIPPIVRGLIIPGEQSSEE